MKKIIASILILSLSCRFTLSASILQHQANIDVEQKPTEAINERNHKDKEAFNENVASESKANKIVLDTIQNGKDTMLTHAVVNLGKEGRTSGIDTKSIAKTLEVIPESARKEVSEIFEISGGAKGVSNGEGNIVRQTEINTLESKDKGSTINKVLVKGKEGNNFLMEIQNDANNAALDMDLGKENIGIFKEDNEFTKKYSEKINTQYTAFSINPDKSKKKHSENDKNSKLLIKGNQKIEKGEEESAKIGTQSEDEDSGKGQDENEINGQQEESATSTYSFIGGVIENDNKDNSEDNDVGNYFTFFKRYPTFHLGKHHNTYAKEHHNTHSGENLVENSHYGSSNSYSHEKSDIYSPSNGDVSSYSYQTISHTHPKGFLDTHQYTDLDHQYHPSDEYRTHFSISHDRDVTKKFEMNYNPRESFERYRTYNHRSSEEISSSHLMPNFPTHHSDYSYGSHSKFNPYKFPRNEYSNGDHSYAFSNQNGLRKFEKSYDHEVPTRNNKYRGWSYALPNGSLTHFFYTTADRPRSRLH